MTEVVVELAKETDKEQSPISSPPTSFPKNRIKILLLENIHPVAAEILREEGFSVELLKHALNEEELVEKIRGVHILGIRSKTTITERVLHNANRLLGIGCFCIGTNQVDLEAAEKHGIPVFNSPFCNTRSVAEMIIAQIINLSRQLGDRNKEMHSGVWHKTHKCCHEIRGKTLGIVGYGHIGSQLSVLAEAMGMRVIFYDVVSVMPLGNSQPVKDLATLLRQSDFVSLHVPATPQTKNMITMKELELMRPGSFLLNASRGNVVVIDDLVKALSPPHGHLGGAYIDVFPMEPKNNKDTFHTPLANLPNVMLTPHIGGSTEEAQYAIGVEVARKFVDLINTGSTIGAVNFPAVSLPYVPGTHRILNIHQNIPGVLKEINGILSEYNISGQVLSTRKHIGYLIAQVDSSISPEVKKKFQSLPFSLRTRILY